MSIKILDQLYIIMYKISRVINNKAIKNAYNKGCHYGISTGFSIGIFVGSMCSASFYYMFKK